MTIDNKTNNDKTTKYERPITSSNTFSIQPHPNILATSLTTAKYAYERYPSLKPGLQDNSSEIVIRRKSLLRKLENGYPENLKEKLIGDVLVAFGVTLGVAPFMTVVDKAIVQRAAGTHSIFRSSLESASRMIRHPITYARSPMFLMMWGVYAATYTTANCLKTIAEHENYNADESKNRGKWGVFAGTTFVNSSISMMKDRAYATMFGTAGSAHKVPLITYGLWGMRDCMVIGSSFILPEIISRKIEDDTNMDKKEALRISQFICPIATQFLATPVQLLGLDYYNRPLTNLTITDAAKERMILLGRNYFSIVAARIARIAPAYGIGGIGNTYFRDQWRDMLIRKQIDKILASDEGIVAEDTRALVELVSSKIDES